MSDIAPLMQSQNSEQSQGRKMVASIAVIVESKEVGDKVASQEDSGIGYG